ncbi:hypothetical protein, partial [Thermogemmatispora sp.]
LQREQSWHYSIRTELGIDFCLWMLRIDGLRVAPFDTHPDGTHLLQAAGLTPEAWRSWFLRVLAKQRDLQAIEDPDVWVAEAAASYSPVSLWPGSERLKERLQELWLLYEMLTTGLIEPSTPDFVEHMLPPKERRRLWKDLTPFQQLLPPLDIYLVDYPHAPLFVYPPTMLVIGNRERKLQGEELRQLILQGARELATAGENRADQFPSS